MVATRQLDGGIKSIRRSYVIYGFVFTLLTLKEKPQLVRIPLFTSLPHSVLSLVTIRASRATDCRALTLAWRRRGKARCPVNYTVGNSPTTEGHYQKFHNGLQIHAIHPSSSSSSGWAFVELRCQTDKQPKGRRKGGWSGGKNNDKSY